MGILHRLAGLGVGYHRGSLCLQFVPGSGCTLGIPRKQAKNCLHSCPGCATLEGLYGPGAPLCLCSCFLCSFLHFRVFSFLLCQGSFSSPTRLTDSSPTGKSSFQSPFLALGPCHCYSPALCSPAGENVCCLLV